MESRWREAGFLQSVTPSESAHKEEVEGAPPDANIGQRKHVFPPTLLHFCVTASSFHP